MLPTFRRVSARLALGVALVCALTYSVPVAAAGQAAPSAVTAAAVPVRILAVGDSITADGRWQAEFSRLLTLAGVPHVIETEAVSGTRCRYWNDRINGILAAHQPDLVILYCGTNDDTNEMLGGEPATSISYRIITEAVHTYRPSNPAKMLGGLLGYSDPLIAPQWLLDSEPVTNDRIWSNAQYYLPPRVAAYSWFAGFADVQKLAATATYLDNGGIHPTARGYRYIGRLFYDAAQAGMGWPSSLEPPLCDLYGLRKGNGRPANYTLCLS